MTQNFRLLSERELLLLLAAHRGITAATPESPPKPVLVGPAFGYFGSRLRAVPVSVAQETGRKTARYFVTCRTCQKSFAPGFWSHLVCAGCEPRLETKP